MRVEKKARAAASTPAPRVVKESAASTPMQSAKAYATTAPDTPKAPDSTPQTDDEKKSENSRALRLAAGLYVGTSAGMGLVTWGLNSILPTPAMRAIEPMVYTTQNVLGGSGARFNDWWTNLVHSFVFRFVKGENGAAARVDNTQSKLLYPALQENFVQQYTRRSKVESRKTGQTDTFVTYEVQMMMTCKPVKARLDVGDLAGAARMLAAEYAHDKAFWYEYTPHSKNVFELLYVRLHPYFARLDQGQRTSLQMLVHDEVSRLAAGRSDAADLIAYGDMITQGLVSDARTRRAAGSLPGLPGQPLDMPAREALAASAANSDAIAAIQKPAVTSALSGAWNAVKGFFSKRESRLIMISVGAFAAVGALSGVGKYFLGQAISPAVMTAVDALIFSQVGLFMGVAGAFFQDKYGAWTRSFSYRGAKATESLGKDIEQELLEQLFRTLAQDGRIGGTRASLTMFELTLHNAVVGASRAAQEGDLESAAEYISGIARYGRTMFFEFSPLTREMQMAFLKSGPHFDVCTAEQRDQLIALAKADIRKYTSDTEDLAEYFDPFVNGLLTTNVQPLDRRAKGSSLSRTV